MCLYVSDFGQKEEARGNYIYIKSDIGYSTEKQKAEQNEWPITYNKNKAICILFD